jgi:hypothetical protein
MTDITMNYIVNPFAGLWRRLLIVAEIIGYSRAAAELSRQGLYKEAKACMMQVQSLRASK